MGIGKMGFNMAENLIRAGYQLVVYDKNVDAVDKLISMGARGVASPLELGTYPGNSINSAEYELPTNRY